MSAVIDPEVGPARRRLSARRRDRPEPRPHGWGRAGEQGADASGFHGGRRAAPAGTSLLLLLVVGALAALGIVRVRASTEVLELGAEITEMTTEQELLLDQKHRLEAERAYLRHPDHIQEVARDRLRMIPVAPVLVQTIRVVEDVREDEEESNP
jgi:cell division protein FtsL